MRARKFTRYPADTSISFVIDNIIGKHQLYLHDAGQGGLCFNARACIKPGTRLNISIPSSIKSLNTSGKITWCQPIDNGQCQLGIEFEEQVALSTIENMVLTH